jgi:hypothetical protein
MIWHTARAHHVCRADTRSGWWIVPRWPRTLPAAGVPRVERGRGAAERNEAAIGVDQVVVARDPGAAEVLPPELESGGRALRR